MKPLKFFAYLALPLLLAGCVQDPAEVDYKGDEFFGRVHEGALDSPNHETYPEDSPRIKEQYARPVEQAPVQTVGVSDLAPPQPQPQNPPPAPPPQKMASLNDNSASVSKSPYANEQQIPDSDPFIWPVAGGKIISHFGPKSGGRSNDGINISVAEGEPIYAAGGGTVVYAANELKGYGNMVIIRHGDGWMTAYAHARSIAVKKGDSVKQGDIIGYVGQTGSVTSPQLHFAIRDGRTPVDPELYLPKTLAGQ